MKEFIKSRVAYYVLFIAFYYIVNLISGFEMTCIIMGGTIIGEQAYLKTKPISETKSQTPEKNDNLN